MNMKAKTNLVLATAAAALLWGSVANAAPLSSVTGRWSIIGNQHSGFLDLAQSVGTAACRDLNGTIYPGTTASGAVRGYYCPATGRIAFARKNASGVEIQTWVGNVSDAVSGLPFRMGGTFHALDAAAGSGAVGEYHFQGQR